MLVWISNYFSNFLLVSLGFSKFSPTFYGLNHTVSEVIIAEICALVNDLTPQ